MLLKSFEYLSRVSNVTNQINMQFNSKIFKKNVLTYPQSQFALQFIVIASHLVDNMNDSLPEIKVLNWGSIQSKLLKSRNFAF